MVYGIHTGGRRGGRILHNSRAIGCCTRVGNADGEGQQKEDSLVHTSFEVNEYLVKAKPDLNPRSLPGGHRAGSRPRTAADRYRGDSLLDLVPSTYT